MQSEARAPIVQAPIAWVARRLLASDELVKAVMVTGGGGKVLAHERALGYEGDLDLDELSLLFYVPMHGLLFYIRKAGKNDAGINQRINDIIGSPSLALSR